MADEPNTNPAQETPIAEPVAADSPDVQPPVNPSPAAEQSSEPGSATISQGELDALLASAGVNSGATASAATAGSAVPGGTEQDDLAAEMAAAIAAESPPQRSEPPTTPFRAPEITASNAGPELTTLELLDDVELDVKVELGRTDMYIEDILQLGFGSVVSLNKLAGDPVDVFVNERLVARGEVLVLNDNFCVRINEIVSPAAETEATR